MADFFVDPHFIGEVEVPTTASTMWLWNEGCGGGLCHDLSRLSGSECSLHFSQRGLLLLYSIVELNQKLINDISSSHVALTIFSPQVEGTGILRICEL
jgi:hypothetical protein